ncbi:MAG: hypothetical protein PHX21_05875 [bacterium]|nr:hypothetical protein [bacterium]
MRKPKQKKRYLVCGFCNGRMPIPNEMEVGEKRMIKCEDKDCGATLVITKLENGKLTFE